MRPLGIRQTCNAGALAAALWMGLAAASAPAGTGALAQTAPADVRADFLRIIDRPRVEADPSESAMAAPGADLVESRLAITTEPGQRMPALLIRAGGSTSVHAALPVVIVLHGTGQRKEDEQDLLLMLARAGFLAVAPDGRYHGERSAEGHGTKTYYAAIAQAHADGRSHPWLYDEVYDLMRLVDYLQTRPDVDGRRIGLMGISKGGMETYLTAAVDPRIAVAVPCISIQSFRWELDHDQWHGRISTVQGAVDVAAARSGASPKDPAFIQRFYDRVVPGITGEFDCPAMLPLIAPRPLLAVSGEKDPINPLPSAMLAADAARQAYSHMGAGDRFQFIVEPGVAHGVTVDSKRSAVAWFVRWLLRG